MQNDEIIKKLQSKQFLLTYKTYKLQKILLAIIEFGNINVVPTDVVRSWFAKEQTNENAKLLEIIYGEEHLAYFYDDEKRSMKYIEQKVKIELKLDLQKITTEEITQKEIEKLKNSNSVIKVKINHKNRKRFDYADLNKKEFDELISLDYKEKKLSNEIGRYVESQKISTDSTLDSMHTELNEIRAKIKYFENLNMERKLLK